MCNIDVWGGGGAQESSAVLWGEIQITEGL